MHDGTVRELIFMEDSINRSKALVSGGAGNCHICLTDCTTGQTFKDFTGHTGKSHGKGKTSFHHFSSNSWIVYVGRL
jgi:hypothetical protein